LENWGYRPKLLRLSQELILSISDVRRVINLTSHLALFNGISSTRHHRPTMDHTISISAIAKLTPDTLPPPFLVRRSTTTDNSDKS